MDGAVISPMLTPVVQYGFAGLCTVMLAGLFWMFNKSAATNQRIADAMIESTKAVTQAITKNTEAVQHLIQTVDDMRESTQRMNERLVTLQCSKSKQ